MRSSDSRSGCCVLMAEGGGTLNWVPTRGKTAGLHFCSNCCLLSNKTRSTTTGISSTSPTIRDRTRFLVEMQLTLRCLLRMGPRQWDRGCRRFCDVPRIREVNGTKAIPLLLTVSMHEPTIMHALVVAVSRVSMRLCQVSGIRSGQVTMSLPHRPAVLLHARGEPTGCSTETFSTRSRMRATEQAIRS